MRVISPRLVLALLAVSSLLVFVSAQGTLTTLLSSELCGIVNSIRAVVGVLALALFLIGGVMYAIAHFLPPSVDFRKSLTGWSTAMITGGIIGLIVVIIAPSVVQMFTNAASTLGSGSISLYSC